MTIQITPKLWVVNTYTTNIAQIQNRIPARENAPKTASFAYRSWCDMIRTQILNRSENARLARVGFSGGNRPQWNTPGFSSAKTHCNGSCSVPTRTRNQTADLEPLLTLAMARGLETLEHDIKAGCCMAQRGWESGWQQSDGYQTVSRCLSDGCCWWTVTGGWKRHHVLRGSLCHR